MGGVNYSFAVESLMYVHVCRWLAISLAIGVLERYMSNLIPIHYQAAKNVFRYLQYTKDHVLTYLLTNSFDVVVYYDADYKCYVDDSAIRYVSIMEG